MDGPGTALRVLDDRLVSMALSRTDIDTVTEVVGESLRAAGVPVDELRVSCRTLHPDVDALGVAWVAGKGLDSGVWRHADSGSENFLVSPIYHMMVNLIARLHRPLHDPECPLDFPVLQDFRDEGITDYLSHLLPIGEQSNRPVGKREGFIVRWLSRAPKGFSDSDLAVLDRVTGRLVAACEPWLERTIARNLLNAYVGLRSGSAVLEGSVQAGDTQSLEAVILVADLAGFTAASDTMDGERLVAFLDRHFEAMVPPVQDHGGEILAFLGDGFLAAFDAGDPAEACGKGAAAARAILSGIDALRAQDSTALPVDVSLHIGTVRYGNVGAGGRQAFTVIGPAVNLASRIEALCGALGCPVLLSAEVAAHLDPAAVRDVGAHPVRGASKPVRLFSLI